MKYIVVNAMDGTFRIHRPGCRDIMKTLMNGHWESEAPDTKTLVAQELADLAVDFGDGYNESYFVVLPCAKQERKVK